MQDKPEGGSVSNNKMSLKGAGMLKMEDQRARDANHADLIRRIPS
jgi:hypothetical protein